MNIDHALMDTPADHAEKKKSKSRRWSSGGGDLLADGRQGRRAGGPRHAQGGHRRRVRKRIDIVRADAVREGQERGAQEADLFEGVGRGIAG